MPLGVVHKLRLQDEVGRWYTNVHFLSTFIHRGQVVKKSQNLVNVVCERPLVAYPRCRFLCKLFQSPDTLFSRVHYERIFLPPLMALSSHSRRGKCLIWDFTCIDMLSGKSCLSYFNKSDKVTEAKINYLIQSTFLDTGYLFSQLNIFSLRNLTQNYSI